MRSLSSPTAQPSALDAEDFQAFVLSRGTHLYRTACLLTGGDSHLAEDLVQETLGRMFAKWGRRGRIENPAAYAQSVLVNAFIATRRRKSSAELPTPRFEDDPARGRDEELRLTLLAELGRLEARDRAVLVLRYWEDHSVEETARMLGLSVSAVKSRSSRALARLREQLGADFLTFAES
ncbi:SigE family RNA polymerase sigma factor [Actinospica robiniae]|uniref:SigE family RNA polymerase sigma factor n=1 Tax=Actinospica robiniae TaxID=304901 RepID=UPI001FE15887|nr:SigE family RNA polymerase sigma factor [Actinospica robiniae]